MSTARAPRCFGITVTTCFTISRSTDMRGPTNANSAGARALRSDIGDAALIFAMGSVVGNATHVAGAGEKRREKCGPTFGSTGEFVIFRPHFFAQKRLDNKANIAV